MLKKLAIILVVFALVAVPLAAESPKTVTGKVTAIGDGKITITLDGEKADWLKKSTPLKFTNGNGKVLTVTAEDVSPVVITVKTKLASKLKVDDAISFQKGKAMSGC